MHPKFKGLLWLLITVVLGVVTAYGLPYFARYVPWSVEKSMGRHLGGLPENEVCFGKPTARASLEAVVHRLYPLYPDDSKFPISVEIISGSTVNAFATLGGKIYVYEGLLKQAQTPEELAGVLAHEIEHVKRRHIIQGVFVRLITVEVIHFLLSGGHFDPRLVSFLLNMRFGREQESEADQGGLVRLRDAHISVAGFEHFFERAESMSNVPTVLMDHPATQERMQLVQKYLGGPSEPVLSQEKWLGLQSICRLNL